MKKCLSCITFVSVKLIYCAALLVVICFAANAQEMSVRIHTVKNGLPSNYVFGTYQDKLGYLWVGSPVGLSRFDGKSFTNYGLAEGLPDTRVICEMMDSRYRYLAGTSRV